MALDLNEYIKMSYERPNRKVLEGLGASEGLIEYLMETPGNTNWNVVDSITNPGGGSDTEVWLVGDEYQDDGGSRTFTLANVDETDHIMELINNASSYDVYLNGVQLPYLADSVVGQGHNVVFFDGETEETTTRLVSLDLVQGTPDPVASAVYVDASTAPTSVEVSVKAK